MTPWVLRLCFHSDDLKSSVEPCHQWAELWTWLISGVNTDWLASTRTHLEETACVCFRISVYSLPICHLLSINQLLFYLFYHLFYLVYYVFYLSCITDQSSVISLSINHLLSVYLCISHLSISRTNSHKSHNGLFFAPVYFNPSWSRSNLIPFKLI